MEARQRLQTRREVRHYEQHGAEIAKLKRDDDKLGQLHATKIGVIDGGERVLREIARELGDDADLVDRAGGAPLAA